jgi:hypothetical protein
VVSVLWFVISGARKQKTKRIVYGRRVLKEGMIRGTQRRSVIDGEGTERERRKRGNRGVLKEGEKKRCAKGYLEPERWRGNKE